MDRRVFLQASLMLSTGIASSFAARSAPAEVDDSPDMIWDLHCHLSGVPGETVKERIEQLLVYADRMGVQRLVFFMGWPFLSNPTPEQLRKQNDQVLEALALVPDRLFGFTYVSGEHPDESLKEIERCIAGGPMLGIKLWTARHCSEAELDPIVRRCGELQAVVYQHTWLKSTGNEPGESTPMDVATLAKRYPDVRIICGHTGGNWTSGIRAVRALPNVTIDLGGSEPTAGFVEMAVRELGAERVLFGSDIGGRSLASQLSKVYGAEITPAERKLILGQNLKRLLTPILTAKGVQLS
jgi:predicted TIM-barrel fold metal-dependent hydrolase